MMYAHEMHLCCMRQNTLTHLKNVSLFFYLLILSYIFQQLPCLGPLSSCPCSTSSWSCDGRWGQMARLPVTKTSHDELTSHSLLCGGRLAVAVLSSVARIGSLPSHSSTAVYTENNNQLRVSILSHTYILGTWHLGWVRTHTANVLGLELIHGNF